MKKNLDYMGTLLTSKWVKICSNDVLQYMYCYNLNVKIPENSVIVIIGVNVSEMNGKYISVVGSTNKYISLNSKFTASKPQLLASEKFNLHMIGNLRRAGPLGCIFLQNNNCIFLQNNNCLIWQNHIPQLAEKLLRPSGRIGKVLG
jgi:hypothetical protein